MDFLKKLIEKKETETTAPTPEPITEAAKLEFPEFWTRIGDFYLSYAGVYQNQRGDIEEVMVNVDKPNGEKYRVEFYLVDTPVRDAHDAKGITFDEAVQANATINGTNLDNDTELERILVAVAAKFANDTFADAAESAFAAHDRDNDPRAVGEWP